MDDLTKLILGTIAIPVITIGSTAVATSVANRQLDKKGRKTLILLQKAFSGRTIKPLNKMTDEEVGKLLDDARTELAFRKIVQNQD